MENLATNTTTPSGPPRIWVPEPKQRGTFGVFLLCFSTLVICTWSSLHFSIPARRYSAIRRLTLHVSWTIFAFSFPEILLILAMNERINADTLVKRVLEFRPHLAGPRMFTRMWRSICGVAAWIMVSAQYPYVIE